MTDPQLNPQQAVDDALAPSSPSMPTLPPAPAVAAEPPVTTPLVTPPVEPVTPIVTTTTTTTNNNVAMGDETPLAFVTPSPVTPPPTTTTTTTTMAEPAYIPPAQDVPQDKPKKSGSKILMTLLGIFALLATLSVGGYYAFQQFVPKQTGVIAELSQAECGKCDAENYETKWDSAKDKCVETKVQCGEDKKPKESPTSDATDADTCARRDGGFWCAGCGGFCNTSTNQTCDQMQVTKCGQPVVRGASCSLTSSADFFKVCTCDGKTVYFNATGSCESTTNDASGHPVSDGLCQVYRNSEGTCGQSQNHGGDLTLYSCNSNGCTLTADGISAGYKVQKYHCDRITNLGGGCQDGTPASGNSQTFSASCGAEQIDVQNGTTLVDFRSRINATACGKTNNTTPELVCDSLTKNVADAAITLDTAVTLTCAGSITPVVAGATITYQFRYMIGTGAWQTLANATAKTATLTPTQCGVKYTAQCRACATIDGVKQCDPIWQGVAP